MTFARNAAALTVFAALVLGAPHARAGDTTRAGGTRAPSISLAPWTGPNLPGSIAGTIKYRLVVTGAPDEAVSLRASGLPKAWVASFCTDKVCAPFHVATMLPPAGVKVIEFQVIPDGPKPVRAPRVRVEARAGAATASATTVVAVR